MELFTKEQLKKYADILVKKGANLQPGQPLYVNYPPEAYPLVREIAKIATELGTLDIVLTVNDPILKRMVIEQLTKENVEHSTIWDSTELSEQAKRGAAHIIIRSGIAASYKGLSSDLIKALHDKHTNDMQIARKLAKQGETNYTIAMFPTKEWAKSVFPNHKDALTLLSKHLIDIWSLDTENPNAVWDGIYHDKQAVAHMLNELNLREIHFSNEASTDVIIGLPEGHKWIITEKKTNAGVLYMANFPSFEIFTSPHRDQVNGVVHSSKPLYSNGIRIEDFKLAFKDGKVIDFEAEVGEDELKRIVTSLKNMDRIGEVALVAHSTNISKSGVVFRETLHDENASSHLALGSSFSTAHRDAIGKSPEELIELGLNQAKDHKDLMFGTDDMQVIGVDQSGKEHQIMENGEFVRKR